MFRYQLTAILLISLIMLPSPTYAAPDSTRGKECVAVLHGLARTASSMRTLANKLSNRGYTVINIDYPSRQYPVEKLAEMAVQNGVDFCRDHGASRIHFVTHSLGGILVRYYLSHHGIKELGRVVMLAPPNQGSKVVDTFSRMPGYRYINGPAGYQLGTDKDSIPLVLGPANFEVGIIAGDRTINFILSTAFDEPNDGKVAVEDAKLDGMQDFLVVHRTHPFIMQGNEVIEQVLYFLEHGAFRRNAQKK